MSDSVLHVRVRLKRYGGRAVLNDTQLAVRPGEIVSLLGPSGCGKSTLLRIAAGLDRDFDGVVALGGLPLDGPSPALAVIFQEPRLLPWLDVANNISFPLRARDEAADRVSALLAEVGLPGIEARWPKELSGGMAQRVAIARGLFSRPSVLLLDEPFSAVDAITRMRLQDLLLQVTSSHRMAALVVTHDVDEALLLSDRVLVMQSGQDGAGGGIVHELRVDLPRPRNRQAASDGGLRTALLDRLAELFAQPA
ncbi:TPA: ABC transporter ATP-binding protein [Burkholderia vietnamiensis]|uniref:ABC transporter ATP-binding protein n=1 Tax=Burkholderia vietnamiensis TaxID=60552 RepID=UPI00075C4D49|nr:ABC transporter ATP-binding protein [Burkholderia vietnamiensis]KVS13181.1 sulfonate ABC transporter ATP-binding protein [Burkholderia vietnamiensis]MCA8184496.1 ABC transporter ATP-binding protein [Burkholderia vietnamiensis]MCA8212128.1 ABC transporter ATP-binding protein [Burkholderia vietnamiensis]MDN8072856.1 ABC transporter ATP-binding protein [Burkholderia vietnamiensis]HDR8987197.1 ABC transporter ATP-binding protein [Burkholderia vietnamiensis]